VQPESIGCPEQPSQAERRVGGHGTLTQHHLVDAPWRYAQALLPGMLFFD
jgi:hypothetical protein